jgi:hypothetical protein
MDLEVICENANRNTFNYIVDYIIAKRIGLNGKIEYLVKWEGWPQSDSTWETADQFASHHIVDIFEKGIQSQMGFDCNQCNETSIHSFNRFKTKDSVKARKGRPLKASKLLEDYRKEYFRKGKLRFNSNNKKAIEIFNSPLKKFVNNSSETKEIPLLKTIKTISNYEKLMGASKRKSRMSCPSAVITNHSNKTTERSERYETRLKLKNPLNESYLSIESNESHENKNPQLLNKCINSYFFNNHIKSDHSISGKKRKSKTNNCNNNKIAKLDINLDETSPLMNKCNESPTKLFLNRVRDRYKSKPEIYSQFLNNIIEFKNSKIEINKLLGNREELINELFNILIINRKNIVNRQQVSDVSAIKTDEEINQEINKWSQKLDNCLKPEEKKRFWSFLENKSYDSILNASPDYLWYRIDKLLCNHKDLREEFKKFMPNLCSKPYFMS